MPVRKSATDRTLAPARTLERLAHYPASILTTRRFPGGGGLFLVCLTARPRICRVLSLGRSTGSTMPLPYFFRIIGKANDRSLIDLDCFSNPTLAYYSDLQTASSRLS